jgi:hypothetical protein
MGHPGSWDKNLPWAEFSYNDNYQESLKMTPFEAIYGRCCCTPLNWTELGEKAIFGLDLVEGDHVYLKVSPMKGMKRFKMKEKLTPCYIRPFSVLEKCGNVAYKLELPPSLAGVHDIFHVSQLKKCIKAPVDVVLPKVVPLEADLTYPEHPVMILDHKDRVIHHKTTKFFKVQWSNRTEEVT